MRLVTNHFVYTMALVLAVCLFCCPVLGYSVLTHEQVVDLMWKDQIQPLLLKRFPGASEDDLLKAHAYAYGGSLVQDMGYYPFGSMFFSDLVHYVRSGDFVTNAKLGWRQAYDAQMHASVRPMKLAAE